MTSRRRFVQSLAALSVGALPRPLPAATDPSRQALVIGNADYRFSPLTNPTNDARAVSDLFGRAGFTVSTHLDVGQRDMLAAIEQFGQVVRRSDTRLVVFYYAGHGAQLDWRNYLLPVDAAVQTPEQMRQRCVDLNTLLGRIAGSSGKTFVIILDACRNNPFGSAYTPEQKGLSQFDAPPGSLLAYATSPGNVASDGSGRNGLYTENLVRELSVPGARIEDALKRVRLNVRLASRGAQVPWETTSLENDVILFDTGHARLSEAEQEKLLEEDIARWNAIKNSRNADDWVAYLRAFPNGRFAEIAQMRLIRLLAEADGGRPANPAAAAVTPAVSAPAPMPAPASAPPTVPTDTEAAPAIVLGAGLPVPVLIAPSGNPFSSGRYPLARHFALGDSATFRKSDLLTGLEERTWTVRVTRVDRDADRVELNRGHWVVDLMGNTLHTDNVNFDAPVAWTPSEFYVGKKWTLAYRRNENGTVSTGTYAVQIVARETITVPAGTFDTFRIEGEGWSATFGSRLQSKFWLVPSLNFLVRSEVMNRNRRGQFTVTERRELVALRQGGIDTSCAAPGPSGTRTLVIRNNCG